MSKKKATQPPGVQMLGYTFYLDPSSFGNASSGEMVDWIAELGKMVSETVEGERFVGPPFDWLDTVTADGYEVFQLVFEDYGLTTLAQDISNRLAPCEAVPSHPADLYPHYSVTHNAFIGIKYPPEVKTAHHICSHAAKQVFISNHPIQLPRPDFWESKDELFPHLHFLKGLDDKTITCSTYHDFFEKLCTNLEAYCVKDWTTGSLSVDGLYARCVVSVSDESDTVAQNPKLKSKREHTIPGKGKKFCPIHFKRGPLRIYIWGDEENKEIWMTDVFTEHPPGKKSK